MLLTQLVLQGNLGGLGQKTAIVSGSRPPRKFHDAHTILWDFAKGPYQNTKV
jgi:hypothetical protein